MFGNKCAQAACVLLLGLVLTTVSVSFGDTVYFKDGRKAEGKIISQDEKGILLEKNGSRLRLPASAIERVEQSQEDPAASALAKPRRLAQAGRYEQAYRAYEALLGSADLPKEIGEQAQVEKVEVLSKAVGPMKKPYLKMIEGGDFGACIRRAQDQCATVGDPATFANLLKSRCEADVRVGVAERHLERGNVTDAGSVLKPVREVGALCPGYPVVMGTVHFRQGRYEQAVELLAPAVKVWPGNHAARSRLLQACCEAGRLGALRAVWDGRADGFASSDAFTPEVRNTAGAGLRGAAKESLQKGEMSTQEAGKLFYKGIVMAEPEAGIYREGVAFYKEIGDLAMAERMEKLLLAQEARDKRAQDSLVKQKALQAAQAAAMKEGAIKRAAERQEMAENAEKERVEQEKNRREQAQRNNNRRQNNNRNQRFQGNNRNRNRNPQQGRRNQQQGRGNQRQGGRGGGGNRRR